MATFARTKQNYTSTKKKGCVNPLFEEWLIQWRDEAKEKGHQSQFGFDRALKSLRQFPLPLKNGTEASQILKYWGDKLGKMVDSCVAKYEQETGEVLNQGVSALEPIQHKPSKVAKKAPAPAEATVARAAGVAFNGDLAIRPGAALPKPPSRRKKTTAAAATAVTPAAVADPAWAVRFDGDDAFNAAPQPAPKRKRASPNQEYVPQRGSGPYAILLALLKASRPANYPGYMTKADLQHESQVYSTKSMSRADPGSYYTAWSSASSLVNKGMMTKKGCPARYALTANGEALAERLEAVENGAPLPASAPSSKHASGSSCTSPSLPRLESARRASSSSQTSPPCLAPSELNRRHDSPGSLLSPREMAARAAILRNQSTYTSTSGSKGSVAASLRFEGAVASSSSSHRTVAAVSSASGACITLSDGEEDEDGTLVMDPEDAYQHGWEETEYDFHNDETMPLSSAANNAVRNAARSWEDSDQDDELPLVTAAARATSKCPATSSSGSFKAVTSSAGSMFASGEGRVHRPVSTASDTYSTASAYQSTASSRAAAEPCVPRAYADQEALSAADLTFPAGSYEIVLLCDTAERRDGYTGQILEELERNHIRFERRKLHVGDYVWIAQQRVQPLPGQLRRPPPRELVMDYIVERKRMDDLASSIVGAKDRYREQKFRIAQSGLAHPIYLVEDYKNTGHVIGEDALYQAMATTQVQDGYFVKHTHSARDSAAYLTLMSRRLVQMYEQTTVASCTRDELARRPDTKTRLLHFNHFNELAVKNKAMSVSELFARQLMQLTGISAVRAASILQLYPTPRALMEAYDLAGGDAAKRNLLSHLTAGAAQRRFNSLPLYHMYAVGDPIS